MQKIHFNENYKYLSLWSDFNEFDPEKNAQGYKY